MTLRLLLVLPLLALVLLTVSTPVAADPPADAFCVILIEPVDGFRVVRYTIDEETNLTQRQELWPTVDTDGNARITLAETDAFRQSQVRLWRGEEGLGLKAVTLTPLPNLESAQKAIYATTWRQVGHVFHQQTYRLPDTLTQAVELETQEVREFRFDLRGDPQRIALSGGRELNLSGLPAQAPEPVEPRIVIEYVVLRAPAPWLIESVRGSTYNGTFERTVNAGSVDVPAFDTKSPYTITYVNPEAIERNRREGGGFLDLHASGFVAVAMVVVGIAVVARRRG